MKIVLRKGDDHAKLKNIIKNRTNGPRGLRSNDDINAFDSIVRDLTIPDTKVLFFFNMIKENNRHVSVDNNKSICIQSAEKIILKHREYLSSKL